MKYTAEFKQNIFDKFQSAVDEAIRVMAADEAENDVTLTLKEFRYLTELMERYEVND